MATIRFSIPMIADIDDNHPAFAIACKFLTEEQIARMLAVSVAATPEFDTFMAEANEGATWCVANLDIHALA